MRSKPRIYGLSTRCTFHDGEIQRKETFVGTGKSIVKAHRDVSEQIEQYEEEYNTDLIDREDKNFWL